MKHAQHIEIVRSSTVSLSSMGQQSADMIQAVLKQHYRRVGITLVKSESDLERLVAMQPDLVLLGMKRIIDPTEIWLAEYLDEHNIRYSGSSARAIALDFDKPAAKRRVKAAGLPTADYFTASPGQYKNAQQLPLEFPLFIKPPAAGGGKGIGDDSVVRDFGGFQQKVQAIAETFDDDALVESYLPGREFSVAILGNDESNLVVMPIELIAQANERGDRILGKAIKQADTERIVAVTDPLIKQTVTNLATEVYFALGASDYGRIDIRLDNHGQPHFLEANLVPGLADHDFMSYFTHACRINQAMDYQTMILSIVRLGLASQLTMPLLEETALLEPLLV